MVLSVTAGVHIGSWTNFQLGIMREPSLSPPYAILWPSFEMMGLYIMCCILLEKFFSSRTKVNFMFQGWVC